MKNSLKLAFLTIFSLILAVFSANAQNSTKVHKGFNWSCDNQALSFDVLLEAYPSYQYPAEASSEADYYAQVLANSNNFNSNQVTKKLVAWGETMGLSVSQQAWLTIRFYRSLHHIIIPGAKVKFPDQTLIDGSGDCDDITLATYYSLKKQGYSVALVSFSDATNKIYNHLALGLGCPKGFGMNASDGAEITYVEMFNLGNPPIGQMPSLFIGKPYTIILHEIGPKIYTFSNN